VAEGRGDETVPGRSAGARAPGWREVLIVAAIVVGTVFAVQVLTSLLPTSIQELVFRTPLAILVLVVGTLGLLLRIVRRRSS
jgi:hypothetical protein